MKLSGFLQNLGKVLDAAAHPPVNAKQRVRAQPRRDGFEVARRAPVDLGKPPGASAAADGEYVKSLYRELLGREPDLEGFRAHVNGLASGMSREAIKNVFLSSPELREKQAAEAKVAAAPPAAPVEPTTPAPRAEPGPALSTVPQLPAYATAPIDRSSDVAAARSAAQWVKDTHPELFGQGDDRAVAFQVMSHVIGAMRAAGFDAHRVVNHPSRPVGDGQRYGSDALVVGGQIYDVYGAFGDPGRSDVQALNPGPYEAGRLRE